jgi:hypothetical protein
MPLCPALFRKDTELMFCRRPEIAVVALALATLALPGIAPCQAQVRPNTLPAKAAPDIRVLQEMLERVSYDPTEQGPLLAIAPGPFASKRPLPPKERPVPSLGVIAAAASRDVVKAGAVTVLAPDRMMVINANPGKALPLAGMRPDEKLKAFLATLTEEQWKIAGGPGIGMGDLSPDQQLMYDSILPPAVQVSTFKIEGVPDDPTGKKQRWNAVGEPATYDRATIRLRLKRSTQYIFYASGEKESRYGSGDYRPAKIGDTVRNLAIWRDEEQDGNEGFGRTSAFGVKIRQMVPSRLKPGHIDYAASSLNILIPLTPDLKTVRDVLKAVGQRTNLELHADRRVADLPIFLRAAPNQGARAGDLLMALAWGITGTYRRMEERVFLLTDDVEGIGSRFARLSFWGMEADQKKRELLDKGLTGVGRQNPLPHLKYDTDAPGALPDDIQKSIEGYWKKSGYGGYMPMKTAELPAAVRRDVEEQMRVWTEQDIPISLDTSRVEVSMSLGLSFVLPDGSDIRDTGGMSLMWDSGLLARLMGGKSNDAPRPPAPPPPAPKPLPDTLARGVLISAPRTADEAKQLITAIKRGGLTELWVQVPFKGTEKPDTSVLTAAIAAGKQAGITVYAVVSLLKGEGIGTSDRNILDQDGDALAEDNLTFYSRLYTSMNQPQYIDSFRRRMAKYRNWMTPDPAVGTAREKQILAVAAVPGLAGITLRNTGGPGYTGPTEGGDGIWTNGALGYTPAQRLAFLRKEGVDPIDLAERQYYLDLPPDLPFFSTNDFQPRYKLVGEQMVQDTAYTPAPRAWQLYRETLDRELLTALYTNIRKAYPNLPLYMDDRVSSFTEPNTSWYGSWDAADKLPKNPIYRAEGEMRAAARSTSKTVLLHYEKRSSSGKPDEATLFARTVERVAGNAAKDWNGMVLDLSELPLADCLRLLGGIPARP